MSLLFNMLSRLVITFLPKSKHLLISWLQSPSAVILEPKKINSVTVSTISPSRSPEVSKLESLQNTRWQRTRQGTCCPKDSQESSPTPQFKSINSPVLSTLYGPTLTSIHDYWKTIAFTRQIFVDKLMSLLFNMLSRLVIAFLPRSKHLLISWL